MTTVSIPTTTVAVTDSGTDVALTIGAATTTVTATGGAGPANSLAIGSVTAGTAAAATITGTPPSQTLDLTLPGAAWGNITGTLADQTDLGVALAGKAATSQLFGSIPVSTYYVQPLYGPSNALAAFSPNEAVQYFLPIYFQRGCTLDRLGITVQTTAASAGGVCRLGLYAASTTTGLPTTLIVDGGTVDTTTTGDKLATISQAVNPGLYWLSMAAQGAPATRASFASGYITTGIISGTIGTTATTSTFVQTTITGAFANVTGALIAVTAQTPRVYGRVL